MNGAELLAELDRLRVRVEPRGDRLHIDAPAGALTPELRELLGRHKTWILQMLTGGFCDFLGPSPSQDVEHVEHVEQGHSAGSKSPEGRSTSPFHEGDVTWNASALVSFAMDATPPVCFTLWETKDVVHDVAVLIACRRLVAAEEPGFNRVILTIRTLSGRKVRAEWRAVATPELRRGLAAILREEAVGREGANA